MNAGALRCVRTNGAAPTELTGFYILLALSRRCEGLILDGAIDVGVAMPASETLQNPIDADAFYIGMIQGLTVDGRFEILLALLSHLVQISHENGRQIRVYARPGHESSRRHMDAIGFKPVPETTSAIERATIDVGGLNQLHAHHLETQARRLAIAHRASPDHSSEE